MSSRSTSPAAPAGRLQHGTPAPGAATRAARLATDPRAAESPGPAGATDFQSLLAGGAGAGVCESPGEPDVRRGGRAADGSGGASLRDPSARRRKSHDADGGSPTRLAPPGGPAIPAIQPPAHSGHAGPATMRNDTASTAIEAARGSRTAAPARNAAGPGTSADTATGASAAPGDAAPVGKGPATARDAGESAPAGAPGTGGSEPAGTPAASARSDAAALAARLAGSHAGMQGSGITALAPDQALPIDAALLAAMGAGGAGGAGVSAGIGGIGTTANDGAAGSGTGPAGQTADAASGASAADAVSRAIQLLLSAAAGSAATDAKTLDGAEAAAAAADGMEPTAGNASDAPATGSASAAPDLDAALQLLAWLAGTAGHAASPGAGIDATGAESSGASIPDGSASGASSAAAASALPPDPSQSAGAALAHLGAAPHASHAPSQTTAALQAPVGTSAWIEELGAQLTWMANRGIESASLHVSPAELGPIEVRISVHGTDASVWFGATQAATRAALQHALPQLRHLFASQGLALADAGVSHEPPRQAPHRAGAPALRSVAAVREAQAPEDIRARAQLGLLDLYA